MRENRLILFFIVACLCSCQNEPVGLPSEIEELEFATGSICTGNGEYKIDNNNLLVDYVIPNNLPDSYDLSHLLPPIGNQGQQGSCVSWAISYYMKSLQEGIESNNQPFTTTNTMSPAYTYNQLAQGNCLGTQITETLELLKDKGVCSLASFPYNDTSCSLQPNEEQNDLASTYKISDYKSLSGQNMVLEMKALINEKTPIIIGAYLSSEFGKIDNFGLAAYREHLVDYSLERCHAMLVIGYSDDYSAFKVANSWGNEWGNDGFVWVDYKAFENVLDEAAEFKVINQAYIAYDL
ncbi:C1 family peptidase [Gillisia sp. JM1]|uniref:C1 family peptidase n=1 Tax=Gillisia sp. JM1 TaxID=1283286 RepID=UPI000400FE62|nr:C1 family peptidase [Gillisia sp. JM1]